MRILKITLQLVGEKHVVVAGAGDEHVCKVDDAEDIGKAVLAVLETAKNAPVEEEKRTEEQTVGAPPPPSNGSNGETEPTLFGAFANIFMSEEAQALAGVALEYGERLSVKTPPKPE